MKKYSVSLLFARRDGDKIDTLLRVIHLEAHDEEQAFECARKELSIGTKGYQLVNNVVLEFKFENDTQTETTSL